MHNFDEYSENGFVATLGTKEPLSLSNGQDLYNFKIAYQTYGKINKDKSNVILLCHALTGDQFASDKHPVTKKDGWWSSIIGSGKILDTDKYFVICSNILAGCMGSTGPKEKSEKTGKPWLLDFPVITVDDMVLAQNMLLEYLEIEKLFCVIGGSMGGMQVLKWATTFKEKVFCAIPIATSYRLSPQNIAFNEVGRQAITADPNWHGGDYQFHNTTPRKGLAIARMGAHVTYLSQEALQRKFGRNLQDKSSFSYNFGTDFQIESYLKHQGYSFVDRFDANSYLYITKAMDYFDLACDYDGKLSNAFVKNNVKFCVFSFSSDWLFPPHESKVLVKAMNAAGAKVSYAEIESDKGHDAFLLNEPDFHSTLKGFITSSALEYGIVEND
jgi:homoserine O-acetyltransferase